MQECRPSSSVCLCVERGAHRRERGMMTEICARAMWQALKDPYTPLTMVPVTAAVPPNLERGPGVRRPKVSLQGSGHVKSICISEMHSHTNTNTHQVHSGLDMPASGAKSQPAETHGYQLVQYTNRTAHTHYTHTHYTHTLTTHTLATHTHTHTHTFTTHTHTHYTHTRYTHTHTHTHSLHTHTHTHTFTTHTHTHYTHTHYTHTHTHTCWFLWFTGTLHRRNGFYTVQTVCAIALHLPYT